MTLEELVRKRFIDVEGISCKMALFSGEPAIFLQSAPADTQPGWGRRTQYPRIVNTVELRADNERKSQGLLTVDLYCDLAMESPDGIEPLIRAALKDIVVQPDGCSPFCFAWRSTDPFELESKNSDKRIAGYELRFDILEYPDQYTTVPDPVESMNIWIKERFPEIFVIGIDQIDGYLAATDDSPVLYTRMDSLRNDHASYALSWINCTLAFHVIAPEANARGRWVRSITNALLIAAEAQLTDGSPLRFTAVQTANASDYLVAGQVMLSGQYTLPRLRQDPGVIRNIKLR